MTGKLIVFEGIDASGKETQAALLANYLRDNHKTVAAFSFPNYDSWSGKRIKEWLHNPSIMNQETVNMVYSVNRYEMKDTLEQCLKDYDYVILDRYYYSNWIYGSFMKKVSIDWLKSLDEELPKPDMVFLMCIPGKLSVQRSGSMADIHEREQEKLDLYNLEYQRLGHRYDWTIIDGEDIPEKIHWRICTSMNPLLTKTL